MFLERLVDQELRLVGFFRRLVRYLRVFIIVVVDSSQSLAFDVYCLTLAMSKLERRCQALDVIFASRFAGWWAVCRSEKATKFAERGVQGVRARCR